MENRNEPSVKGAVTIILARIEKNNHLLRAHSDRSAKICLSFLKWLDINWIEINQIFLAALLHDTGLIFYPSDIVQARCQLNEKELEIIKKHPLLSEQIISNYPILKEILHIIRYHHEAEDGSGYPFGLKGDKIPFGAKILNIISSFDNMTFPRPYFETVNIERALAELKEQAGKKFNKDLVENFILFSKLSEPLSSKNLNYIKEIKINNYKEIKSKANDEKQSSIAEEIIGDIIYRYENDMIELPVHFKIVHGIQSVLNNPSMTIDEIASIIKADAVISLKLISIVKSPLYREFFRQVPTVRDAVEVLGINEIHNIVHTVATKSIYDIREAQFLKIMKNLWMHSLASGHLARALSNELKLDENELYYFLGLTHEIGKGLLIKTFSEIHSKSDLFDVNATMEIIDNVHIKLGCSILKKWHCSESLVRAIRLHKNHDLKPDTDKKILVVNLACNIADNLGYGLKEHVSSESSQLVSARLLNVNSNLIQDIGQKVKPLIENISSIF